MLYRSLLRPLLFRLPAETAHELALHSLSLAPQLTNRLVGNRFSRSPFGSLKRFGLTFSNPVGLAAGFDKDGVALQSLAALGFGFIEAGTVTNHAQPGNEKPRLFRLPRDKALINRAGFNNAGASALAARIRKSRPSCVLGVSIGKSKVASLDQAVEDYLESFEAVYDAADYIAVNVSSPNTPRLRELQEPEQLDELLRALQQRNTELAEQSDTQRVLPILVKLSPDLDRRQLERIVDVAQQNNVAGLIASNTTTDRAGLTTNRDTVDAIGQGGLSGSPLRTRARQMIAELYNMTSGTMPLVGVGGIFNASDAWEMICAGASLAQIYTGFIYEGPGIVRDINEGLRRLVSGSGFVSLDEAVGSRAAEFTIESKT